MSPEVLSNAGASGPEPVVVMNITWEEQCMRMALEERRVYLTHGIEAIDDEDTPPNEHLSSVGQIVKFIMECNKKDCDIPIDERKPIRLYINSPGGDVYEGFALVDAIKLSKTPVYTYNIGCCCSMAFYIVISGHKGHRFSLPSATFLMHDGSSGAWGSTSKVQDRVDFDKRYEQEVIRKHVLACGSMTPEEYDAQNRVEFYMLPEDAIKFGFIDEIITDIDQLI